MYAALNEANKANVARLHKQLPKYSYPRNVLTACDVIQMSKYGVDFKVSGNNFVDISALDSQRKANKAIFGRGLLLNNAAAVAAPVRKQSYYAWELSDRERDVIAELDSAAGETINDKEANRFEVL